MAIAKMSTKNNSFRYFKISVNEYDNGCMCGILYHAGELPGIRFHNFLEVMLHMNRIFDETSFPKKTMNYRKFGSADFPKPSVQEYYSMEDGKLATFGIQVKYRYNASWQGDISWFEGQKKQGFESFLQMIYCIEQFLRGPGERRITKRSSNVCQIAVNSFEKGLLSGCVQNAFLNYLEDFTGTITLAEAMGRINGTGCLEEGGTEEPGEDTRIIPNDVWASYRKGGKESTFLIKILFKQHSTWQGVIFWRESGEKQAFRSFMELVLLMVSALESGAGKITYEDNGDLNHRVSSSI